MSDFTKWAGKVLVTAIFWVFILSITWNGRTLFTYANETLVQNALVETIDEELGKLWEKVSETAKVTFSEEKKDPEKA